MRQRIELPLAGEKLKETGEIRVDVKYVQRRSVHTIAMVVLIDGMLYQDRFDGSKEDCDLIEHEYAGKDVWAVVAPDDGDKGLEPEIKSVEIVGND